MSMQRNLGGRPKKLDIALGDESLAGMLKNIWNEVEETKLKAVQQYNKQIRNITDNSDIALVGKTNADYLKIVNDCTEKKLSVAKLVQTYIQKDLKPDGTDKAGTQVMSAEDKKELAALMKAQLASNSEEPEPPRSLEDNQEYENEQLEKVVSGTDIYTEDSDVSDEEDDITSAGF